MIIIIIKLLFSCLSISQQNRSPEDDIEEDILEAEQRRRRDTSMPEDPDDIKTYDPDMKTNHYESKGSYTLELVGQRRLLRQRRSKGSADWSNAVENSLLAFINESELDSLYVYSGWNRGMGGRGGGGGGGGVEAGGHVLWFGEGKLRAMPPNIMEWYDVMPIHCRLFAVQKCLQYT